MTTFRSFAALTLCALLLSAAAFSGCAGNRPPQTVVAQTTTDIVTVATQLQQEVNRLVAARTLPVAAGDRIAKANETIHAKATQVSSALKAYQAATDVASRQSRAQAVQTLIAELNGPLAEVLGVQLPPGAAQSVSRLVGNVMLAVSAVQAEVAKGLGGLQPVPQPS